MSELMLKQVTVKNFRAIRDVTVDLEPFTVIVGQNDTGKSSFLRALAYLGNAFEFYPIKENTRRGPTSGGMEILGTYTDGRVSKLPVDQPEFPMTATIPYRLEPDKLRVSAVSGQLAGMPLPANGEFLVDVLDRIPFSQMGNIQRIFAERIPSVAEVLFPVAADHGSILQGRKEIAFRLKTGAKISADEMSDGGMLILAFLAIVFEENSPSLLLIEEPENGIHPKQLRHLVELLNSLTERPRPIQVVLTTHSPYLLDYVPHECVRVFARDEAGEINAFPMTDIVGVEGLLAGGATTGEIFANVDESKHHSGSHHEHTASQ